MIVFILLSSMAISGCLGALARQVVENSQSAGDGASANKNLNFVTIFSLGVASSLVVPLFLSIANNTILQGIIGSDSVFSVFDKLLIVTGFCVLAGATASTFIDSMARQALRIAERTDRRVETLRELAEDNKELIAEGFENRSPSRNDNRESLSEDVLGRLDISASERRVLEALDSNEFNRRSVTGISKETQIDKRDVRDALESLLRKGLVNSCRSTRTGAILYELKLQGGAEG